MVCWSRALWQVTPTRLSSLFLAPPAQMSMERSQAQMQDRSTRVLQVGCWPTLHMASA